VANKTIQQATRLVPVTGAVFGINCLPLLKRVDKSNSFLFFFLRLLGWKAISHLDTAALIVTGRLLLQAAFDALRNAGLSLPGHAGNERLSHLYRRS
jgi:hypothetical protein